MAEHVLKDTRFWLEGVELTGQMNETRVDLTRVMKDRTVFGENTESFAAGVKQGNMVHGGFWNAAEPDLQFHTLFNNGALSPATVASTGTVGDAAYIMNAREGLYQMTGQFGDLFGFQVGLQAGDSPVLRGLVMIAKTSTGAENGTALQLGALSATETLYVAAHVTAFTGTDVVVNMESDDAEGFPSASAQGTPLTFSGVDGQWGTAAGAVTDDWWRVRLSGTFSSATVAVVFGIL